MAMPRGKSDAVQVNIRFRPLMEWEKEKMRQDGRTDVESPFLLDGNTVIDRETRKKFPYDTVLPYGMTQEEVYNHCAKDYVKDLMDGFNVTIFAYGTTGSGKTFTMAGEGDQPGITPRMVQDIFSAIETYGRDRADTDPAAVTRRIEVVCSYFEIYNGRIVSLGLTHRLQRI